MWHKPTFPRTRIAVVLAALSVSSRTVSFVSASPVGAVSQSDTVDVTYKRTDTRASTSSDEDPHWPSTDPTNKAGWVPYTPLTDEFNGDSLDMTKWTFKTGWKGRAPGLFDPDNVEVGNGTMQMYARHAHLNASQSAGGFGNYTTASIHSVDKTDFGYFEIRSKSGSGMVSSSWWFHDNNGTEWTEIDVFESTGTMASGTFPQQLNTHTHIFYIDGVDPTTIEAECGCKVHKQGSANPCTYGMSQILPFNMSDAFHVFGLEWNATTLSVYVDTKLWYTQSKHCMTQPIGMDFDRETMPGWFWPENAPAGLPLGSPFEVDYVRAWKLPSQP